MVDPYTQVVQAISLTDVTAENIKNALTENWICMYGHPENILTEKCSYLTTSIALRLFYIQTGIHNLQMTSYHDRY